MPGLGMKYSSTKFWRGDSIMRGIGISSAKGVTLALLRLKALSVPLAPKDTGALRSSATVIPAKPSINPEGALVFDTPYAAIQHEDMDYHHDEGQAHYVSDPAAKHAAELNAIIGGEIRVGIIRS